MHFADRTTIGVVTLSSYTRLGAALSYTINQNYRVQLNFENLTDKKYYLYANGDNTITPGSPRAYHLNPHTNF